MIAGICAVIPGGDDSDSDADPIETRWEECFDPWDGNHRNFEQLVKDQLNAPSTFNHVETRYSVGEFPRSVVMTYEAEICLAYRSAEQRQPFLTLTAMLR